MLHISDWSGSNDTYSGTVVIDGPTVSLTSEPFPPILELDSGEATVALFAEATGGNTSYSFSWSVEGAEGWELNVDPDPTKSSGTATYSTPGSYEASVIVSDKCQLTDSKSIPILVVDEEEDGAVCHPTAQKISEAVNSIFPDQAEQMYNCQDIFDIFEGALTGNQLGFGRMWHAYQLSENIDELTWEEILGWHLNNSGWGALTQINRFAELLDSHSMRDLYEMVMSGEQSVGDLRTAVRAVTRYEADLEDALQRINDGANPGELGQFYKLASEMNLEPEALDEYLADGMTLQELRHAASFAERVGAEWTEIVDR